MSASLYRWSESCNYQPCCGDCDHCKSAEEEGQAMRDYDKIVKCLREAAERNSNSLNTRDVCRDAADAIEELLGDNAVLNGTVLNGTVANLLEQLAYIGITPKWISVQERLPEHGQKVLCACRAGIYEVFKYVDGISNPWYKDSRHVYMKGFVTHWTPLPEPPKE